MPVYQLIKKRWLPAVFYYQFVEVHSWDLPEKEAEQLRDRLNAKLGGTIRFFVYLQPIVDPKG